MLADLSLNRLTAIIIEAAMAVHRALGPGLLESAYITCLIFELRRRGLKVEEQRPVPLNYCGVKLDCGYRLDLVVEGLVIVEVKALERFAPIHTAQMLTYLRLTNCPVGLLLNFNAPILKEGLKRVLNTRSTVDSGTGQPNTHD
ncbi:MAG: GxxExxY protein [Vicinamibacterales bacterium]